MTLQTAGLVKSLTFFAFVQELIGCFDLCMTPEEENRRFSSILIFKVCFLWSITSMNFLIFSKIFNKYGIALSFQKFFNYVYSTFISIFKIKIEHIRPYEAGAPRIVIPLIYKTTIIMINIRRLATFSSRKFYELVNEQNIQTIPEVPEDAVLSKYVSLKQQKSNHGGVASWQKQNPTKLDYSVLLSGSPYGSVQNFIHRNHELTLISTNYYRTDEKKLHKVLYHTKPDAIVIQRRPEYHLHNFNMFPKGSDGVFSDRLYLDALRFTSATLLPTAPTYRPVVDAANKSKDDVLQKNPAKEILQEKGFRICTSYSSSYTTPMFFGEIPLRSFRQWLANTHTLMELQEIFKVVCQRLPRYKHLSFTPYQMATLIYPDIFLKMNDSYMATIIEMLISTKSYKKIVGIFGIVENEAVRNILQKNEGLKPVIEYLIPPGPQGSIVRDIEQLEIVEKQIILDVMFFGPEVENIKSRFFHTTNAVIEKYAKDIDKQTLMQFRYDKTTHYLDVMQNKYKQGEEQIKKQFVRETLREKKN